MALRVSRGAVRIADMNHSGIPSELPDTVARVLGDPVPGISVGALDDDHESYRSYGVRSVEDPVPVSEDTLFRVASISKLITATLLIRLGVDPDSTVRERLPGFRLGEAAVAERLTVRDLLTHRAGFAPDHALGRPAGESDDGALARAVADLAAAPQIFPPRRFYGYSNAGFVLLARIAEVVAGEPYEHAVRRLVFEPAGMERSTFFADEAITYPIALGHTGTPPQVVRPWGRSRARNGAGGLMTTARDLIAFARHVLKEDPQPGWTPLGEGVAPGEQVGAAWNLRDLPGGGRIAGHQGLTLGYASSLTVLPESGKAYVILANSDAAGPALDRATGTALGLRADPPRRAYLEAPDVRDHLGVYTDGSDRVRVDGVGDGVVLSGDDTGPVRYTGHDEGRGRDDALVRFIRDDGRVTWLQLDGRILRKT